MVFLDKTACINIKWTHDVCCGKLTCCPWANQKVSLHRSGLHASQICPLEILSRSFRSFIQSGRAKYLALLNAELTHSYCQMALPWSTLISIQFPTFKKDAVRCSFSNVSCEISWWVEKWKGTNLPSSSFPSKWWHLQNILCRGVAPGQWWTSTSYPGGRLQHHRAVERYRNL